MTEPDSKVPPAHATPPSSGRPRSAKRLAIILAIVVALLAAVWFALGRKFWEDYQSYRRDILAAEESVPVGYEGTAYRRTYNDRPPVFLSEKDGRKLLWASVGKGDGPEFYDVTEAAFPVQAVSGGFGKDSIPGIDYPLLEETRGEHAQRIHAGLDCFGVVLDAGPRAYPVDLLRKIELVNDRDGETPFVVVIDRSLDQAGFYPRQVNGKEVTFGTTGYALEKKPLLYDRTSKSLWLPSEEALVCVNGEWKGTELRELRKPERVTWGRWTSQHPETLVLVGSERPTPDLIPEK